MIALANADSKHIPLADNTVQCVVTSPPYWGLRSYNTGDNKHLEIGAEPTPALYVASIVAVMREAWRVLRDDGTVWLNLGDTYAANCGYQVAQTKDIKTKRANAGQFNDMAMSVPDGLKPKDLVGIPWRVAFALQDDGWYLRSDIIWNKPNPMPESVTDRPTKAHEYVFLLTKSARYYYDAEAVKEQTPDEEYRTVGKIRPTQDNRHGFEIRGGLHNQEGGRLSRNRRSVWTVATSPYSGAHYATFPPALVEPMILAGSAVGSIVLDPFAGSGTVGEVCRKFKRNFIGLDLSAKYLTDNAMPRAMMTNTAASMATLPMFASD